jgi:putative DNA primase/helicase
VDNGNSFTSVASAQEAVVAMRDLSSPVAAFAREKCELGIRKEVSVDELYKAYQDWCDDNGHLKHSKQIFGRDLRAAIPSIIMRRPRDRQDRVRVYTGIGLQPV